VSKKYGNLPNLLLEIWNEPTKISWDEAKEYAEELIPIIRKYAPQSIIIVPTPRWDQDVDKAADNPIEGFNNIMYSLHYYAATHGDKYRAKAQYAISKGLPLFMSECAAMVHTGDGVIDTRSWEEWMKIADDNKISWIAWSISDKDETCSMLRPSAKSRGTKWTDDDLKPWAVLTKYYLKHNRQR
jgi:endoglucanase